MRETLEQHLCFCPALSGTRIKYLGASQFKALDEVLDIYIKSQLKCVKMNLHLALQRTYMSMYGVTASGYNLT